MTDHQARSQQQKPPHSSPQQQSHAHYLEQPADNGLQRNSPCGNEFSYRHLRIRKKRGLGVSFERGDCFLRHCFSASCVLQSSHLLARPLSMLSHYLLCGSLLVKCTLFVYGHNFILYQGINLQDVVEVNRGAFPGSVAMRMGLVKRCGIGYRE